MKTAKVIPLISLFFVSGLLSAMIFHSDYENPDKRGMNGLYAGGLFTVAAIVAIAVLRQTNFMRKSLAAIALFTGLQAQGQDTHKWQLIVNLQPELTFHRNNYSIIWSPRTIDTITRVSMSYGAGAAIKYKVSKICFSRWEQILFSEI